VPFRTRPGQPRDLLALIEVEVRERLEEAVDSVSLEAMVQSRRARGLPPPAAESPADREEFTARARAFLERLAADLEPALGDAERRKAGDAAARAGAEPLARLIAVQVVLARSLPDYWQRFDAVRTAYLAEQVGPDAGPRSSGERPSLFRRLLGA
jgi:hypothetical protein